MKTRLWILVVASLFPVSNALAQDAGEQADFEQPGITQGDIVGPLPPAVGRISCFKLEDEPNFCVLPDRPHIINHTIPVNIIDLNGAYADQNGNIIYFDGRSEAARLQAARGESHRTLGAGRDSTAQPPRDC
jgi:hypothetical protein